MDEQDLFSALRAVAILGPGLIGGSLGLALQERCPGLRLRVWSRPSSAPRAATVFPEVTSDPCEAVEGAEVVVLCTPVGAMAGLARAFVSSLSEDAVVTDAASVKGSVNRLLGGFLGARFVGAHPMAGSEKSGLDAATADLFQGATCLLTPSKTSSQEAVARVDTFWREVGCKTLTLDAEVHDRLVARASHLPHAVACALARAVTGQCPEALSVTGPGYRDTTRVAAGPPALWAEIFMENRSEVLAAVEEFGSALTSFQKILATGTQEDMATYLAEARPSMRTQG